jgi:hypothetical protein
MKKLLDLSEECVKTLSKRAIDENTNFKNLAESILEAESKKAGGQKIKKKKTYSTNHATKK